MPGWSGHILEWGGWWKLCSPAGLRLGCGYCNAWTLSPLPSLLSVPLPLSLLPGAAGTGVKPAILGLLLRQPAGVEEGGGEPRAL